MARIIDAMSTYDRIGVGYTDVRRPDPRIAAQIHAALGPAQSIINVGAGSGAYEPTDRAVTAVEPSARMTAQRTHTIPVVQASAEELPFDDNRFDAALASLTIHHWTNRKAGLRELMRVARDRIVIFTWEPKSPPFWLMQDYLPEFFVEDLERFSTQEIADVLGDIKVIEVPVPHDCTDGFLGAYWRRPEAYLDPAVRRGISSFADGHFSAGLQRLSDDLQSGRWVQKYGHLQALDSIDVGYRLIVAELNSYPLPPEI